MMPFIAKAARTKSSGKNKLDPGPAGNCSSHQYSVDRYEGSTAVLVDSAGKQLDVPSSLMGGVKSGVVDVISCGGKIKEVQFNQHATDRMKARIDKLLEKLRKGK